MAFSWQMGEELAAAHMRGIGFPDAQRTKDGADGGIDVRATDAVAQVKHQAVPVGSPAIQQLRGAAHGVTDALFYSSSGYTTAAIEVANATEVELYVFDIGNEVRALGDHAEYRLRLIEVRGRKPDEELLAGLDQVRKARQLLYQFRAFGQACERMLVGVQEGEIEVWSSLSADAVQIHEFVAKGHERVAMFNAAVEQMDPPLTLKIAKDSVVWATAIFKGIGWDQKKFEGFRRSSLKALRSGKNPAAA